MKGVSFESTQRFGSFFMLLVHLIEIKFHQPDTMILLVLHINRNAVVVLLGCSTSGLVSDLSPAYEDQISQLTFQQFFKEKK
jgi:hypothetical protein